MDLRFSRQVLAFGEEGQRAIEAQKVGIVGLGGLGSHVAQALAYLGVRDFILVDHDNVDETNLNRLIGGSPADAEMKTPKVFVAERTIHRINPSVSVQALNQNLRSAEAIAALTSCNAIFSCVDEDGPRLILMELACAYEIVLLDSASEIILDESRTRLRDFGGRVIVCRPGDFCLTCASELNREVAKAELEPKEVKAMREAHGYGLGPQVPSPAVVSLNGTVANLAVTEFLVMVTRLREPFRKRVYQGLRGVILENKDARKADCFNCVYLVGKRERADIYRYVASPSNARS